MTQGEASEFFSKLGLNFGVEYSAEELKAAWRQKCMENHPDKGGDQKAFIEINHAYKMLSDLGYRESQQKVRKENLEMKLIVPVRFEDAFYGKRVVAQWSQIEVDEAFTPIPKEMQEICIAAVNMPVGRIGDFIHKAEGKGFKCGSMVGSAMVIFRPGGSDRFQVQGSDVFSVEHVPLDKLLVGGKIEVMTMWGLKTLGIPAGTVPGEKLKLKNCGVAERGFHWVECQPVFPNQDTLKNSKSWHGLNVNWDESETALKQQLEQDFYFEQAFQTFKNTAAY